MQRLRTGSIGDYAAALTLGAGVFGGLVTLALRWGSVAEALRQFGGGYVQGLGRSARNNALGYGYSVTATADHAMLDHLAGPSHWPRDLQWPVPAHPSLWRDRSAGGMKVDRDKALTGEFAV